MLRFSVAVIVFVATVSAQEHGGPASYPARAALPTVAIGAEYLGHGVPTPQGAYIAKDYLVVRVGVFPSTRVAVAANRFALRVDGELLPAQPPALLASSLTNSDWRSQGRSSHTPDIVLGGAPLSDGAREEGQAPARSPRAPGIGEDSRPVARPDRSAAQAADGDALPSGTLSDPVRGLLYFHYTPKTKTPPHSVELIYDAGGAGGKLTIRLL
jgi:hypothetical protein